jgi:hypothetical protein
MAINGTQLAEHHLGANGQPSVRRLNQRLEWVNTLGSTTGDRGNDQNG